MNKHLRYVKKWLDANKLALNLGKTNFVLFHSPQVSITELIRLKFGKKTNTPRKVCQISWCSA